MNEVSSDRRRGCRNHGRHRPSLGAGSPAGAAQLRPPAAYLAQRYPFPGLAPEDAYREGLINRWELERYEGPTAQAMQGPSVDGSKGNSEHR
jgi:hypothetical protein